MLTTKIEATTISDAWFQLLRAVLDESKTYIQPIQRGSYAKCADDPGQFRRQFYGVDISIAHPDQDIVPVMPPGIPIPPPTSMEYIEGYFAGYLMRADLQPLEQYTYGERIAISLYKVIEMLRETPFNNQSNLQVGQPTDIYLDDPPCLRIIDLKVIPAPRHEVVWDRANSTWKCALCGQVGDCLYLRETHCGKHILTMTVYFRSWDLWSGFPANLGGFELLKQYIADEAGLANGPMFAYSAGLHLYEMYEEVARIRTGLMLEDKNETKI